MEDKKLITATEPWRERGIFGSVAGRLCHATLLTDLAGRDVFVSRFYASGLPCIKYAAVQSFDRIGMDVMQSTSVSEKAVA